ncbi:MAG: cysteine dioxygenase family protein [Bacteroidales bacterium]|nr:cysteine dioxygenase family protein [Bacteroidales bacterium]
METIAPKCINQLVKELNSHQVHSNELVSGIVSSISFDRYEIEAFNTFNHNLKDSYGRKLVYDSDRFKILVMSWLPGDFTAIHNHGYTEWGSVHFFGEATHRLYENSHGTLDVICKEQFGEGQNAAVCGNLTHLMGNNGKKAFVTLHIYGKDSDENKVADDAMVYLPEFQKVATTSGTAYLNLDRSLIKSETPYNAFSDEMIFDYFKLIAPFYCRNNQSELLKKLESKINNEIFS